MRIVTAILSLLLVAQSAQSQSEVLPVEPFRKWEIWFSSLVRPEPLPLREFGRPFTELTSEELNAENIHHLLERAVGVCPDLRIAFYDLSSATFDLVGFRLGAALTNRQHKQYNEILEHALQVEPLFEKHGQTACAWLYRQLGPDGSHLEAFKRYMSVGNAALRQVLWRAADVCRYPFEFWAPEKPRTDEIQEACKNADKHTKLWHQN